MSDSMSTAWNKALQKYLQEVGHLQVKSLGSIDSLVDEVTRLQDHYCGSRYSLYFNRLRPFLDWIYNFHHFVRAILQITPTGFDLFWGVLLLALEARLSGELELIAKVDNYHGELITLLAPGAMFVGNLPFNNLPVRQNPAFVGRGSELDLLQSTLLPDKSPVQLPCACLYGLAGVGKSQLALQFAYKHIDVFDAILWISAESEIKLRGSLGEIANGLGLVEGPFENIQDTKEAVMRWLHLHPRSSRRHAIKWLLIFDNAEDVSLVNSFWPRAGKGSIIITCKSPEIAKQFSHNKVGRIQIKPFSAQVASNFLLSLIDKDHSATEEELQLALDISTSVGYHPLALDMVGCYIRRCGYSLVRFLEQHPSFETDLLFRDNLTVWSANIYQRFVDNALHLGLGSAVYSCALDPSSECLLQMMAFLDVDGIPVEFFTQNSKEAMLMDGPDAQDELPDLDKILENPFRDPGVLDKCLQSLLDLALITIDEHRYRVQSHCLILMAVRSSMAPERISFILSRIVFFLNSSFPEQQAGKPLYNKWSACKELATNVVSLRNWYKTYQDTLPPPIMLCEVMCRCAWYFLEQGASETVLELSDDAIHMCENALKRNQHAGYSKWFVKDMISHHVNTKATIDRELPSIDHGLRLSQQVCRIRRQNKRTGSQDDEMWIAAADGNLAVSLIATGKPEEALVVLLSLLEREDMRANEDIYLSNTCLCYLILDRLDDAWKYGKRAAESTRLRRGDNNAQTALIDYYKGMIHKRGGEVGEAVADLERSLRTREQLMPRHLHTALTLHQLGVLEQARGNTEPALDLFIDSFDILSKCECNPGTVCRTLLAISQLYSKLNDIENASKYYNIAEEYRIRINGVDTRGFDDPSDYDMFVTIAFR
ncbi:tetratricopeptide repeat domain-containing protein [Pochonia chlamydosporia 170]|uniref:Tetratricopeptide repeat domain-containing protein n=1 Tax=Pochonia chlamydosporia 170 TaxID=1380566 RepID=A0A179F4G5_METCM|nr:tetratricopeptide repeat domain-containing protein [Pochonia chlamydosporia 170]OAQ60260.1 tetratricopeptide repeat domain-containing protein [Pochonia chlamydosporia 170]